MFTILVVVCRWYRILSCVADCFCEVEEVCCYTVAITSRLSRCRNSVIRLKHCTYSICAERCAVSDTIARFGTDLYCIWHSK